jgi:Ca2+-binding RTX toxin-like protein
MRRSPLTALALLGLAAPGLALLGPAPATAVAETCRGEAATIVGTGPTITGTEGRDVVVTNGATQVRTVGGDDVICVTGGTAQTGRSTIVSGTGDDVVDATTAPGWFVQAELGEGADRFEAGAAGSSAYGAYMNPLPADTEKDVVIGGTGSDSVTSGVSDEPNPDVIDLGAADDGLTYGGTMAPGGSIDGGAGEDLFTPLTGRLGAKVIDNAAGILTVDQQVVATWTGLETFHTGTINGASLRFVGTAADEELVGRASGPIHATFGAGDDSLVTNEAPRAGSSIAGGDGRDVVYVSTESGLLDLDLRRGRLTTDADDPYTVPLTDVEDATLHARRVVVAGTDGRNALQFSACDATLRGRKGADTVTRNYDTWFERVFCPRFMKARINGGRGHDDLRGTRGRDVVRGGPGNDVLDGLEGPDRLYGGDGRDELRGRDGTDQLFGGQGRDSAFGGPGRDTCRAEVRRSCER